jgi:hypothetical protein
LDVHGGEMSYVQQRVFMADTDLFMADSQVDVAW